MPRDRGQLESELEVEAWVRGCSGHHRASPLEIQLAMIHFPTISTACSAIGFEERNLSAGKHGVQDMKLTRAKPILSSCPPCLFSLSSCLSFPS